MRRTKLYPNFPPLVARRLGIRLMYAPPLRHVHHTPLLPQLPRSLALLHGTPPEPETALHHGRRPAAFLLSPPRTVLALHEPAHRRSALVSDLRDSPDLHHRRSDVYQLVPLPLCKVRQLVDEEVPPCVTSPSSSDCTPFTRWPGPPALSGSPASRSKCATSSGPPERYFCMSRTISAGKPATRIFPCLETTDGTGSFPLPMAL